MKKLIALMFAILAVAGPARADDTPPDQLVKKTADEVMTLVRQDKDIQAGNKSKIYALVDEKVLPHFDFTRMTRLAVGRSWGKATPEQQTALTKQFRDLLVRTYAVSLSQYRNQTVDYKPLQLNPSDQEAVVRTAIVQSGGQPIPIDYSMYRTPDGWKVYDITVDGVSLVTNYRGSFGDEIKQSGIDGLLKSLTDKNAAAGGAR